VPVAVGPAPITRAAPPESGAALRVYRRHRGWRMLDLRELWEYRELLYFLVWRDVKVRYKQTVLGALWAVLQPALFMVVFTLIFGRLAHLPSDGVPYPVFVYAGLLAWTFFATAVSTSSTSLVNSANLITKIYFPRMIVPLAAVGVGIVDLLVASVLMVGLLVWYHVPVTPIVLLAPVFMLGVMLAATGVGALLAALTVTYRDFRYIVPFAMQLWMYASPVVYSASAVPARWRTPFALNPMTGMTDGFRAAVLGQSPSWDLVVISSISVLASLVIGIAYFQRVERRFVDVV
jgi:lipopolysaccharide transport system permease protein